MRRGGAKEMDEHDLKRASPNIHQLVQRFAAQMETRLLETGDLKARPLSDLLEHLAEEAHFLAYDAVPQEKLDTHLDIAILAMKIYVASKHDGWF
jgi:hypothetical protein